MKNTDFFEKERHQYQRIVADKLTDKYNISSDVAMKITDKALNAVLSGNGPNDPETDQYSEHHHDIYICAYNMLDMISTTIH